MARRKGGKSKSSAKKSVSKSVKSVSITDSINNEVIAEALSASNQSVLLKLCRLCEAKDGPFLNIFEADKVIAKKIDGLMPFAIEEHDDLPHKICFRCSAKVEELYEFVQRCIRTQDSLRKAVGKMGSSTIKPKVRTVWEEKLNQSNISNDDICNALIKKAMEGIKDIPMNVVLADDDDKPILKKNIKIDPSMSNNDMEMKKKIEAKKKDQEVASVVKEQIEKVDQKVHNVRATRSSNSESVMGLSMKSKKPKPMSDSSDSDTSCTTKVDKGVKRKADTKLEEPLLEPEVNKREEKPVENKPNKKPFDIMDHISMIKVNGVGVLFQCKLCNRNFLKKEVVMSHACAKNGGPKQEVIPEYLPPSPPKMPVVKYINTKVDGLHSKPAIVDDTPIVLDDEPVNTTPVKPKPKVGPASKVKKTDTTPKNDTTTNTTTTDVQTTDESKVISPTVRFPTLPSLNSRYKLVSGPNNTFTLVEEKVTENTEYVSSDDSNSGKPKIDKEKKKAKSKTKSESVTCTKANKSNSNSIKEKAVGATGMSATSDVPYPVGLIKRPVEHPEYTQSITDPTAFMTPAMKKQSYTVVQTGNPSKLLISTKQVSEEVPRKKAKKQRQENIEDDSEQPFSVTLEDTTPPKDPGFFTFINVDPLLQPSYVLPTDNIIQESQISTSTAINNIQATTSKDKDKDKEKYACNMCNDHFSREKKLLAHIHSHYNKMDEEDQLREKAQKRRGKKS